MSRLFWPIAILFAMYTMATANRGAISRFKQSVETFRGEVRTRKEMVRVADSVEEFREKRRVLPRNVRALLAAEYRTAGFPVPADTGKDAWGTVFRVAPHRDGFHIISAGADRKWKTPDDLKLYRPCSDDAP